MKNDDAAVNETFPGAMEFGNSMEITGDGKISRYIGADGGTLFLKKRLKNICVYLNLTQIVNRPCANIHLV